MHVYRRYFSPEVFNEKAGDILKETVLNPLEKLVGLPYEQAVLEQLAEEIRYICKNHGRGLVFGKRQRAACPVWRTERLVMGQEELPRFADRIFLFQDSGTIKYTGEPPQTQLQRRYGHFLGYVSLRPKPDLKTDRQNPAPHIAVAYLVPPRHMSRPRYHVLHMAAGPADSVMPFRATPFCNTVYRLDDQRADSTAGLCLLSAVHSALLLKMNSFGCTPVSVQDMLAILWKKGVQTSAPKSMRDLASGVDLNEVRSIISDENSVAAGGFLETISGESLSVPAGTKESDKFRQVALEATRCITDYLASGLPVILHVKANNLDRQEVDHGILLVGMHLITDPQDKGCLSMGSSYDDMLHRIDLCELPGRLVVHDLNQPPFAEAPTHVLLESAWVGGKIRFLAVGPAGSEMPLSRVRQEARRFACKDLHAWKQYCLTAKERFFQNQPQDEFWKKLFDKMQEDPWHARICVRLCDRTELERRYSFPEWIREPNMDENSERHWWAAEIGLPWSMLDQEPSFIACCWPIRFVPKNSPKLGSDPRLVFRRVPKEIYP